MKGGPRLTDSDFAALADFRHTLRGFLAFSEAAAASCGLTPQQHQALLVIRGAAMPVGIGYLAERLVLKPHSASGLVNRLEVLDLIVRRASPDDRRQTLIELTPSADALLENLSTAHRDEIIRLRPMLQALLGRYE